MGITGTKRAMITGAGSQDGSYLAEFLLKLGYEVCGISRRSSGDNLYRLKPPYSDVLNHPGYKIVYGDVTDYSSIERAIFDFKPHEFYNIAAQSFVGASFDIPIQTIEATGLGAVNCLESIRQYQKNTGNEVRSYFCGSSEMFGSNYIEKEHPAFTGRTGIGRYQDENTPLCGNSPYGLAKILSHNAVKLYRESYGIKCCSGFILNHESQRRGVEFVTRKITDWFGRFYNKYYKTGRTNEVKNNDDLKLKLGWIDSMRDWSHAKDVVRSMFMMVQNDCKTDYVVSSGTAHSVREFLELVFGRFNLDYNDFIVIDPKFLRPREVEYLQGDSSRIRNELGWHPEISFEQLVDEMVDFDIKLNHKNVE